MPEKFAMVYELPHAGRVVARAALSVPIAEIHALAESLRGDFRSCSVTSSPEAKEPGLQVHTLEVNGDSHSQIPLPEIAEQLRAHTFQGSAA